MEAKNIFISATGVDLAGYVRGAAEALEAAGYRVVNMARFMAQPEDALSVSLRELESCDYVVGIYGRRYGHIPEDSACSITEREYHHAARMGKPLFAFLVADSDQNLLPGPGEDDDSEQAGVKQQKLRVFKEGINAALVRAEFHSPEDLNTRILASLTRYGQRPTTLRPPVDTQRLVLSEEIRIFHNDQLLHSFNQEQARSLDGVLQKYQRAARSAGTIIYKENVSSAALCKETAADQLGRALAELFFPAPVAPKVEETVSRWRSSGRRGQFGPPNRS